jgi:hypothetical protein
MKEKSYTEKIMKQYIKNKVLQKLKALWDIQNK